MTIKIANSILYLLVCTLQLMGQGYNEPHEAIPGNPGLLNEPLWEPSLNTVYIDPANKADLHKNGTISHPYSSFENIPWKDGVTYAIQRGSSLIVPSIEVAANNVTIASYGSGKRPLLISTSTNHALSTHTSLRNITFRDLEINAPSAVSCIMFKNNNCNVKVINCKLQGSMWGLRCLNNIENILVSNTEIFNIKDDGIFIKNTQKIEIAHCYIYRVNQNWKPPQTPQKDAAGDGIQLELCNAWHVHHNRIDRTDNGNKFCFIANNPLQNNGVFEFNVLKGPKVKGSSIYLHDGDGIVIRYNFIESPADFPIYSHGNNLLIYNNIIKSNEPVFVSGSARILNNLFYNNNIAIQGGSVEARNNIFDMHPNSGSVFQVKNLVADHNLYTKGFPTAWWITGKPKYTDPSKNNYRLRQGSPGIDMGIDVGISTDLDGNTIPAGKKPDIGPYELLVQ